MTIQELQNINGGSVTSRYYFFNGTIYCPFPLPPQPPICFPPLETTNV